jgi:hypothetical protein
MVRKYTNIFGSNAFQNLPNLGFSVGKYTIWQSWLAQKNNLTGKSEQKTEPKQKNANIFS